MAFIPLPDGVKVEFHFTLAGRVVVNILYFTKPAFTMTVDVPLLAYALVAWFNTYQKEWISSGVALNQLVLTDLREEDGEQIVYTSGLPIAGTDSSPALPANVALVMSFRTDKTGRSFRGRSYIAGLTEAAVTGNEVSGDVVAGLIASYEAMWAGVNTHNWLHVVASYQHSSIPRITAVATPVATLQMNTRVDTQRRRLG